jgi:hypothetical protein
MNRPQRGISRDIFDVINDNGSATYTSIRTELRRRKSSATPAQIRKSLDNLLFRQQIERTERNKRRFIINKAILHEQLTGQRQLGVTKEVLLDAADKAIKESKKAPSENVPTDDVYDQMTKLEYVYIIGLAAATAAITTTVMRYL